MTDRIKISVGNKLIDFWLVYQRMVAKKMLDESEREFIGLTNNVEQMETVTKINKCITKTM